MRANAVAIAERLLHAHAFEGQNFAQCQTGQYAIGQATVPHVGGRACLHHLLCVRIVDKPIAIAFLENKTIVTASRLRGRRRNGYFQWFFPRLLPYRRLVVAANGR